MRSKARRSSAANRGVTAIRRALRSRMSFATRGASFGFGGRGASAGGAERGASPADRAPRARGAASASRPIALAGSTLLALLVFGVAYAQAGMPVTDFIGTEDRGTEGGEFHTPRGIAANDASTADANDGAIYVADDNNQRIQRFDSDGNFERAWGNDVDGSNAGTGFEICTVASDCKAGASGSANGEFDNPQGVAVDQTDGSVYVTDRDNRRVQKFDADGNFVLSFGSLGSAGGELGSSFRGHIAVAPAGAPNAGNVIVADPANSRVQEFDSSGTFVRTFGFDVAASGADDTGTDFEVCTASGSGASNCKAGTSGSGVGQFASSQPRRVAVDTTGSIYAVESSGNYRVQKFTPQAGPPELSPAVFADTVLTGSSGASAPIEVAVDSTSDDVNVVKTFAQGTGSPPAESTERRILELDSSGTLNDTHLANSGFTSVNGLGINSTAGKLYLSTSNNDFGRRVYIIADVPPPVATIAPATDVSATGATLNGTVEPNGALLDYRFQYSDDGGASWTSLPLEDAGNSTDPVAVEREVDGALKPNTAYQVRLQAAQRYGDESDTSGVETFTTAPSAPTLAPFATADAGETSATLYSRVNPNSEATTYWFEWGTTDSYGNTTSAKSAGSGDESVVASAGISGLSPDTTYHFRLVAENATGKAEGSDHTFTTRATEPASCPNADLRDGKGARLPDCRAYEQVSPVDKNGFDIKHKPSGGRGGGFPAAPGGSAAAFISNGVFADQDHGGNINVNYYLARRGATGWETSAVIPRPDPPAASKHFLLSSPGLDLSLLDSSGLLTDEPAAGNVNVYLRDNAAGLTQGPIVGVPEFSFQLPVASPDLRHVAFRSAGVLTGDPGVPGTGTTKVYEIIDGGVRLVSVRPDGTPFGVDATPAGGDTSGPAPRETSTAGGVSHDGRHVFFTTTDSPGVSSIYRRSDGSTTTLVSPSKRTPADPDGPQEKKFRVATTDGNRVFFTTPERLTDDANPPAAFSNGDLYRYDVDADELVNVSAETVAGADAAVQGVVGIDDAGNRVYYVADAAVESDPAPSGATPVAGQPNLYLWEDDGTADGRTRFIATLVPFLNVNNVGDGFNWRSWEGEKVSRVTPDGRFLLFQSGADIPDHDDGGATQVYRYDAAAGGDLVCVSCNPRGETPIGPSTAVGSPLRSTQVWGLPRTLSIDGRRVFFDSQDDLLLRDTNGRVDAYMWEEGELSLLSTGKSSDDSHFFNASADGDDALFLTRERLVDQDGDDLVDLYNASVGGGFPAPPSPEDCIGDDCQGEPGSAPEADEPASSELEGQGNARLEAKLRRCTALRARAMRQIRRAQKLNQHARMLRRSTRHQARLGNSRRAKQLRKRTRRVHARAKVTRRHVQILRKRTRTCFREARR